MKQTFNKSKEGLSPVIGVILMIIITIAIAATVYVYVSGMVENDKNNEQQYTYTGILTGLKEYDCYNIKVGNHTIKNVYGITQDDYQFLLTLVGKNIVFSYHTHAGENEYDEAYLNVPGNGQ